jgi:multidrug efflux pump subunit AcrA (membrane-fusion protein)
MGEYGSRLVSAYAEYVRTQKTYERERVLMSKKISSEGDFHAAESEFKKAQADYFGTRDAVAFEVRQNLLEATRDRQLAELAAETAKQKLHVYGLKDEDVAALTPAGLPDAEPAPPAHECTDPNCTDCAAHTGGAAPRARDPQAPPLGWYEVRAPFDGVVVERHLTLGERVGEDSDIFTIVDLSTVWVNLTVYLKDLAAVGRDAPVVLRVDHSGAQTHGRIAMVSPFVQAATRSATARVVLDNRDGRWLPGTFVTGFISASDERLPVVIPRGAVQHVDGRDVVFVERHGGLEAAPVAVGRGDRTSVEIVAGLPPGSRYVAEGAFQLKATLVTSNLDSHAGHGH